MKYPELPIFSFLAAGLVLIPLPWHWRARNVATLSLIGWLFVVDIIYGINSIVWAGNVRNTLPIWCDIATKIVVGASYALPISTACICKHLETVSSGRKVSFSHGDRRRRMLFEGTMCFGLPLIFMALHYIVQGHRFDIIENTGCQAAAYISIPAILIIWLPQLLFSVVTMIYATIALYHFICQRLTFASHLRNSNSTLTTNSYLRLIAMVITEMLWGTALTSFNLHHNVAGRLCPWTNWDDVHYNFSRVGLYPEVAIPPAFRRANMVLWWAMPVSSFIFFVFFGFGAEAKKEYTRVWTSFTKVILLQKPLEKQKVLKINGLPGSSGLKPLKLVESRSNSAIKFPIISNPVLISSSHPSLHTLTAPSPTKSETQVSRLDAAKGETIIDPSDTLSISDFSIYVQSHDSTHAYGSPIQNPVSTRVSDYPPRLPDISLSPALSPSDPPSPVPSVPESVSPTFHRSPPRPGCLPSPVYHRPFCGPSIYPMTRPHPSAQQGIVVTVHRQASVDEIV